MSGLKNINFDVDNISDILKRLPGHLKLKALKILKKELNDGSSTKSQENNDESGGPLEESEYVPKVKRGRKPKNAMEDLTSPDQTIHLEVINETDNIESIIEEASQRRRLSKRPRKRNSALNDFLTSYDVEDDMRVNDLAGRSDNIDGDDVDTAKAKNLNNDEEDDDNNDDAIANMVIKVENVNNDEMEELLISHTSSSAAVSVPHSSSSAVKRRPGRPRTKNLDSVKPKKPKREEDDDDYMGNDDDDDDEEDDNVSDDDDDDDELRRKRKKRKKRSKSMMSSSRSGRPVGYDDEDVLVIYDDFGAIKNTVFQCKTCHKKLSSAYSLKQHSRKHNGNAYVCDHCGSKFVSSTGFKLHMLYHEDDSVSQDVYKCTKCLYAVKSKKLLDEHIKNRHNPNRPRNHICDVCGKGFIVCNQLKRHLLTHSQKDVECPLCPFKTYDQASLERHHNNVHSHEVTIYECELCGQELRSKGTYLDHIRRHVGHYRKQCDICNKPFANASQLAAHKRSHEQPTIPCEVCGKKLRNKHKLYVHMLIHTGQKDFRCPYCSYATYVSHNLKKHCMNRHAVVYPPDKMKKIKRYNPEDILKVKVLKDSIAINCVKDVQIIKEQTRQEEMENEGDVEEVEGENISINSLLEDLGRGRGKLGEAVNHIGSRSVASSEISLRIPTTNADVDDEEDDEGEDRVVEGGDEVDGKGYLAGHAPSATNVPMVDDSELDRCTIRIKPYLMGSSSNANDIGAKRDDDDGNGGDDGAGKAATATTTIKKQYITLKKMSPTSAMLHNISTTSTPLHNISTTSTPLHNISTTSTPLHKRIITINILDQLKKEIPFTQQKVVVQHKQQLASPPQQQHIPLQQQQHIVSEQQHIGSQQQQPLTTTPTTTQQQQSQSSQSTQLPNKQEVDNIQNNGLYTIQSMAVKFIHEVAEQDDDDNDHVVENVVTTLENVSTSGEHVKVEQDVDQI